MADGVGLAEEAEERLYLAQALGQGSSCSADQLRQLHRLVRDPVTEVWLEAADALGRRAARDGRARAEVVALLESPSWELRLRGLAALGALGEAGSGEVLPFLEERLEESARLGDAAQLDTLVQLMAHLEGEDLADRLLHDPRELVRAAVSPHLARAAPETLHRAARDPSVRVRVALASAVGSFEPLPEDVVERLASDPDPLVRAALADELPRGEAFADAVLAMLGEDADPLVREAAWLDGDEPRTLPPEAAEAAPMTRLQELEECLDESAEDPLEALRPVLGALDSQTLERLSEIARDPELAAFCRVLALVVPISGMSRPEARERLLEALGAMPPEPESPGIEAFGNLLAACVRGAEVEHPEALRFWSPGPEEDLPEGGVRVALLGLLDIAGALRESTCALLTTAGADLDELKFRAERDLPEPERSLLRLVAETWSETLEWSIQRMLAGAES